MSSANYKNLYALISTLSEGVKKMEKGKLNPLQVELLLDDARSLHERLAVIQYLSFEKQVKSEQEDENKEADVKPKKKKKGFGIRFDSIEKQEELPKQIDLEDSIDEVLEVNTESIPEKPANALGSINDQFSSNETASLADKLGKQPIKDLTTSIGINEKFLFIEELFSGDADAFKAAISSLNTMESFDQASAYINEQLMGKYKWKPTGSVEKKLIGLIERRYL